MRLKISLAIIAVLTCAGGQASAKELASVERVDASQVRLTRESSAPVTVWVSADTTLDQGDTRVIERTRKRDLLIALPEAKREFIILQASDGTTSVVGERLLPLEQGSNFRDIGGYVTKDGKVVRWGRAFRSGAMPVLTEADYGLLGQLDIDSVVDLRSLEERSLAPDLLDDRTGALFIANDYSMRSLMSGMTALDGENMYRGMEKLLVPQLRSLYRRIMAGEGAVVYHCSAGQDRTGIATALLYDMLGVDRETILADYHLSTQWRDPRWEMPELDPAEHADNPLVKLYASVPEDQRHKAQPLYTKSGASHLAQFFTYLDAEYGGSEAYMKKALGFSDEDIAKLRAVMLR